MKELYTSPELEMFALVAEEKLASVDIEFDDMLASSGGGVSANPDVDIDVPIIKP